MSFGSPGADDGQLQDPSGLAVRNETVVVADSGNARIQLFDVEGTFLEAMPVSEWEGLAAPQADVAIDDGGTVWASSPATNAVIVYRSDGTVARAIAPEGDEQLDRPSGLALRPGGFLFVANAAGNRVSLLGSINP